MRLWVNADSAVLAPAGIIFLAIVISIFLLVQDSRSEGWKIRKTLNYLAIPIAISLFYFAISHLNPL